MLLHDMESPHIRHGNSLGKNILDFTDKDQFDEAPLQRKREIGHNEFFSERPEKLRDSRLVHGLHHVQG